MPVGTNFGHDLEPCVIGSVVRKQPQEVTSSQALETKQIQTAQSVSDMRILIVVGVVGNAKDPLELCVEGVGGGGERKSRFSACCPIDRPVLAQQAVLDRKEVVCVLSEYKLLSVQDVEEPFE